MNGIKLKISKPKDKLPAGSSKLLGNPMCGTALNGRISRKTGILYFFYDLDTMPEARMKNRHGFFGTTANYPPCMK